MAKQTLTGKIVSTKMQKTVVVEVERQIVHPIYKKRIKLTHKIKADTGDLKLAEGDTVTIESTRPISKTKFFKVKEKIDEKKKNIAFKKDVGAASKRGGRKK